MSVPSNAEPINFLINEFKFQRYLEIGVCGYQDKRYAGGTWHNVRVAHKDGVDPAGEPANYHMTSNDFFASIHDDTTWDIIFVDGDHSYQSVKNDAANSLKFLAPGGIILFHDVYPHPNLLIKKYGPPFPKVFSGTWCALADLSITRRNLNFYLYEMGRSNDGESIQGIGILMESDGGHERKRKVVPGYTPRNIPDWSAIESMKHQIFDKVLTKDNFEEVFHEISEKRKSSQG